MRVPISPLNVFSPEKLTDASSDSPKVSVYLYIKFIFEDSKPTDIVEEWISVLDNLQTNDRNSTMQIAIKADIRIRA